MCRFIYKFLCVDLYIKLTVEIEFFPKFGVEHPLLNSIMGVG